MDEQISVTVVEFSDRKCYQMQYRCLYTGKKKTRSSGVERVTGRKKERDDALRAAAKWEQELREGRYQPPSRIDWADFRKRYEDEVLNGLAETTDLKVSGVFNTIEQILAPSKLRDLAAPRLSYYQSKLRALGRSENTIKGHMAHIAAALNWACRMGMLPAVPSIERTKRAKGSKLMKGRPITLEEFERMLEKVAVLVTIEPKQPNGKQVKPDATRGADNARRVASWKHYLRGLWLSGLRLGESLELHWDRDDRLCVDLTGKRPMLRIPAECEKGHEDRLLAIAPEFAEFLLATPAAERSGPVFRPLPRRVNGPRLTEHRVGEIVSAIGKKAGVKVGTHPTTGTVKYASAHDLRRSFGERWATRVMPPVLQELMRHESIETTLRFYVGRNAQATADVLWQAHEAAAGNTSGNSGPNRAEIAKEAIDATP